MSESPRGNGVQYTTREMFDRLMEGQERLGGELRETRHSIQASLRGLELRVIELEMFRAETRRLAEKYVPMIDQIASHDALSEALTTALAENETRGWTKKERIMALVLVACAVVGAVGTFVSVYVAVRGRG